MKFALLLILFTASAPTFAETYENLLSKAAQDEINIAFWNNIIDTDNAKIPILGPKDKSMLQTEVSSLQMKVDDTRSDFDVVVKYKAIPSPTSDLSKLSSIELVALGGYYAGEKERLETLIRDCPIATREEKQGMDCASATTKTRTAQLNSNKAGYDAVLKVIRERDAEIKQAADAATAKAAAPSTLADLKGKTVNFTKGSDFAVTDKSDIDLTSYQVSGNCTTTVKFTNFESYSAMYTGDSSPSWTIGSYLPGYDVKGNSDLCKALDGQKIKAACYSSMQLGEPYHVPGSVVLSSTDGTSRMTIYSNDESKRDQGVFECLKAENFKDLSDAKQVAGGTTPAPGGNGTASN